MRSVVSTVAIHQRIAQAIEGWCSRGEQWHRELLTDMFTSFTDDFVLRAGELPGVRPRVISTETKNSLHEYLSFRYVFRHAYAFLFVSFNQTFLFLLFTYYFGWNRLKLLIEELEPVFNRYKSDLERFLSHLLSYVKTLEENE